MTRGVRGATTVAQNDEKVIIDATEELLREIIACNDIKPDAVCSAIISVRISRQINRISSVSGSTAFPAALSSIT